MSMVTFCLENSGYFATWIPIFIGMDYNINVTGKTARISLFGR
jgi:hypothetical protein